VKAVDLTATKLVFKTALRRGVATIPDTMYETVEAFCKATGRTLTGVGGNFDNTKFSFEPPLTEEEAEAIWDTWVE